MPNRCRAPTGRGPRLDACSRLVEVIPCASWKGAAAVSAHLLRSSNHVSSARIAQHRWQSTPVGFRSLSQAREDAMPATMTRQPALQVQRRDADGGTILELRGKL